MQTQVHPFEAKGMGLAPFDVTAYEKHATKKYRCEFCGQWLNHCYRIHSHDQRASWVGGDCVLATSDQGLVRKTKKAKTRAEFEARVKLIQAEERREAEKQLAAEGAAPGESSGHEQNKVNDPWHASVQKLVSDRVRTLLNQFVIKHFEELLVADEDKIELMISKLHASMRKLKGVDSMREYMLESDKNGVTARYYGGGAVGDYYMPFRPHPTLFKDPEDLINDAALLEEYRSRVLICCGGRLGSEFENTKAIRFAIEQGNVYAWGEQYLDQEAPDPSHILFGRMEVCKLYEIARLNRVAKLMVAEVNVRFGNSTLMLPHSATADEQLAAILENCRGQDVFDTARNVKGFDFDAAGYTNVTCECSNDGLAVIYARKDGKSWYATLSHGKRLALIDDRKAEGESEAFTGFKGCDDFLNLHAELLDLAENGELAGFSGEWSREMLIAELQRQVGEGESEAGGYYIEVLDAKLVGNTLYWQVRHDGEIFVGDNEVRPRGENKAPESIVSDFETGHFSGPLIALLGKIAVYVEKLSAEFGAGTIAQLLEAIQGEEAKPKWERRRLVHKPRLTDDRRYSRFREKQFDALIRHLSFMDASDFVRKYAAQ